MVLDLFTCFMAVGPLLRLSEHLPPKCLEKNSKFGQKSAETCMRPQGPGPKKGKLIVIWHNTLKPQNGQKVPECCTGPIAFFGQEVLDRDETSGFFLQKKC